MKNKNYMKKVYTNFYDFVAECSSKELEYFIFDSKFTTAFNKRISEMIREVEREGKRNIEFAIMFNTEGEIAVIDSYIIGKYIGNNYGIQMEEYYKESSLNEIVKNTINGNKEVKRYFLALSYNIIYNTLQTIYCDITCKKEMLNKYKDLYNLEKIEKNNEAVAVAVILITEDICKYMDIEEDVLSEAINNSLQKRNSQNI